MKLSGWFWIAFGTLAGTSCLLGAIEAKTFGERVAWCSLFAFGSALTDAKAFGWGRKS